MTFGIANFVIEHPQRLLDLTLVPKGRIQRFLQVCRGLRYRAMLELRMGTRSSSVQTQPQALESDGSGDPFHCSVNELPVSPLGFLQPRLFHVGIGRGIELRDKSTQQVLPVGGTERLYLVVDF